MQPPVDQDPVVRGIRRLVQSSQFYEFQNVLSVNRIGVAQPGFDLGDGQPARAQLDGGLGRGGRTGRGAAAG